MATNTNTVTDEYSYSTHVIDVSVKKMLVARSLSLSVSVSLRVYVIHRELSTYVIVRQFVSFKNQTDVSRMIQRNNETRERDEEKKSKSMRYV